MKLQKFPVLAAAVLGVVSVAPTDLWAHGGFGGGRGGGGARGAFAGVRSAGFARGSGFVGGAGRFAGRPGIVGERFNRFDRNRFAQRRFNNNAVIIAGGYGYPYPFYGGYPNYPTYPTAYANDLGYSEPTAVPETSPGLVAGDVVGNVQRVLRYRGFYSGPIDGLSGPATRAAIRAYDRSVGLPPTGMIDARLLISMQLM